MRDRIWVILGPHAVRLAGIVFLAALAGCGTFQQPDVELNDVRLGGLGVRGGTLLVDLTITNPNRFALNAQRLRYDLAVGGGADDAGWVDFASGIWEESFSVPARDSAQVRIPVEFTYAGLGSAGMRMLQTGTFDYRASGAVDVRTPVGTFDVPFRRRGTVSLSGDG